MSLVRIAAVLTIHDGEIIGYKVENDQPVLIDEQTDKPARAVNGILDLLRQAIRRQCRETVDAHVL